MSIDRGLACAIDGVQRGAPQRRTRTITRPPRGGRRPSRRRPRVCASWLLNPPGRPRGSPPAGQASTDFFSDPFELLARGRALHKLERDATPVPPNDGLPRVDRDQVDVEVEHGLAGGGAVQAQDGHRVGGHRQPERPNELRQAPVHGGELGVFHLPDLGAVRLGDHQEMAAPHRVDVQKGERPGVLVHPRGRRPPGNDRAEPAA